MNQINLPVLLLRNLVLFPSNEVRLEFDRLEDKQLLSLSEAYYNNQILVIVPNDPLEEDPDPLDLPKIGVLSEIKMKMDMPNGKTRIILDGLFRVKVDHYLKEDDLFEATVEYFEKELLDEKEETAYTRTLIHKLENYIHNVSSMSNGILSELRSFHDLGQLTDIVATQLSGSISRKLEYLYEISPKKRVEMLLSDMNQEIEVMKLEQKLESKLAHQLDQSQKEFVLREKIRLIKEELGDINDKDSEIDEYRKKIEKLKCNDKIKEKLKQELNRYETMNPNSPELGMIKTYLDTMLSLPWNVFTEDIQDLKAVKDSLDCTHYGLDQVKDRILEYLAVKQNTNSLKSPIICLVGPPGVGKTSFAKSIATSLGRKWTKISVGGVSDEADIVGHRRTYIGSAPGLIIQGMKKAGTSNPVFIIDEIDKMTRDVKGDPASALLEVLDPEQNQAFCDHYIEEEYDLSNVMFITTANYLYQIPDELRDRLEIVELSSYTEYEKLDIAKHHLLPRELKEHGLMDAEVHFTDEALLTIIRFYTKEAGVRDFERFLAMILRKVVKDKLTNSVSSNYKITDQDLEKYLGKKKYLYNENDFVGQVGVVNGLAYTQYGGDILPIEATCYKGHGNLILTGSLGDVMKESATLALSYLKSHAKEYKIDERMFENDIHIHVPEGAVPKDGPSAGVTLTTALLSLFTNTKITANIGMTGEMTLRGKVLPIGGLREKTIGAHRGGIRKIYIPRENEKDLDEIPEEIKKELKFILVDRYNDIYRDLFQRFKRKNQVDDDLIPLPLD